MVPRMLSGLVIRQALEVRSHTQDVLLVHLRLLHVAIQLVIQLLAP